MSKPKSLEQFETWVIRHKETGEYFTASSGKQAWKKPGHAKNAWANTVCSGYWYSSSKKDVQKFCDRWGVPVESNIRKLHGRVMEEFNPPKFNEQEVWECVNISENNIPKRLTQAEKILREIYDIELSQGGSDYYMDMIQDYFDEEG